MTSLWILRRWMGPVNRFEPVNPGEPVQQHDPFHMAGETTADR